MTETTYQEYRLHSRPDGGIAGRCHTNDNLDRGYPSEYAEWDVDYRGYAQMAQRTGLSHIGVSGIEVRVYLDGELLEMDGHNVACRHNSETMTP